MHQSICPSDTIQSLFHRVHQHQFECQCRPLAPERCTRDLTTRLLTIGLVPIALQLLDKQYPRAIQCLTLLAANMQQYISLVIMAIEMAMLIIRRGHQPLAVVLATKQIHVLITATPAQITTQTMAT